MSTPARLGSSLTLTANVAGRRPAGSGPRGRAADRTRHDASPSVRLRGSVPSMKRLLTVKLLLNYACGNVGIRFVDFHISTRPWFGLLRAGGHETCMGPWGEPGRPSIRALVPAASDGGAACHTRGASQSL